MFAARNNKNYRDTAEFSQRELQWAGSDALVRATNARADAANNARALRLEHNWTSDLTPEERQELLGLIRNENANAILDELVTGPEKAAEMQNENAKSRGLQAAKSIDHAALGNTTPVKDQGSCGSCWSFASNTVLEAAIAIKSGNEPEALSEQHLIDCSLSTQANLDKWGVNYGNGGCNGGNMVNAWVFQNNQGTMTSADYPYVGRNQVCAHDTTKRTYVSGKVPAGINQIPATVADIKTAVT